MRQLEGGRKSPCGRFLRKLTVTQAGLEEEDYECQRETERRRGVCVCVCAGSSVCMFKCVTECVYM